MILNALHARARLNPDAKAEGLQMGHGLAEELDAILERLGVERSVGLEGRDIHRARSRLER